MQLCCIVITLIQQILGNRYLFNNSDSKIQSFLDPTKFYFMFPTLQLIKHSFCRGDC